MGDPIHGLMFKVKIIVACAMVLSVVVFILEINAKAWKKKNKAKINRAKRTVTWPSLRENYKGRRK